MHLGTWICRNKPLGEWSKKVCTFDCNACLDVVVLNMGTHSKALSLNQFNHVVVLKAQNYVELPFTKFDFLKYLKRKFCVEAFEEGYLLQSCTILPCFQNVILKSNIVVYGHWVRTALR